MPKEPVRGKMPYHLFSSRLYCRYRTCTGSCAAALADYTADRELHPAPKVKYEVAFIIMPIVAAVKQKSKGRRISAAASALSFGHP